MTWDLKARHINDAGGEIQITVISDWMGMSLDELYKDGAQKTKINGHEGWNYTYNNLTYFGYVENDIGILVGATNHPWVAGIEKFESAAKAAAAFHFFDDSTKVAAKSLAIYDSLTTKVQAEPYNPHDHNAISVSIDDLGAKLKGMQAKSKAGYLRATAAAILRKARPNLFAYDSKLWRLGANPDYFENAIVLRIKF